MSAGKLLLIGGVGVGLALLVAGIASASSGGSANTSTIPAGYRPPGNALKIPMPAGTGGVPFAFTQTSWTVAGDASGAQAGTYTLVQSVASPNTDWVVTFTGVGGTSAGIVAYSQTPNGGLLAQAAAAGTRTAA
jgi:hypothetical protein